MTFDQNDREGGAPALNLGRGRQILAIPGPTTVPDEVLQAMHRPAIDIYAGELEGMTAQVMADMKTVFRTQSGRPYIYIANGHGAWEAAISNTMSPGEKILVLGSGRFAEGWGDMAGVMGCDVETLAPRARRAVDPQAVEDRLRADDAGAIEAILVVQIDTASSVVNDIPAIRQAIDAAGHDALLMVDGVASIGCMPFEMDAWGVDLAMTGSQKGLMTPPGLGFVCAGPRALARCATAGCKTTYWDWEFRDGALHYQKYCGTPPEHLIFAQTRALDMLLREEGLENAWARHAALASASRAAIARWAEGGAIEFNVVEPSERCDTVTSIRVGEGYDGEALRRFTAEHLGVALGTPIGEFRGPGGAFRFAHMGHVNAPHVLGALAAVETGMRALGWPTPDGALDRAIAALTEAFATSAAAELDQDV